MVRWLRWHCPPDTGFEIRALAVWGRARYLSVTEAPHNTDFHTWMGKKHVCFFETADTGNRTPNSGVKGSGANHYPRAPALLRRSIRVRQPDHQWSCRLNNHIIINRLQTIHKWKESVLGHFCAHTAWGWWDKWGLMSRTLPLGHGGSCTDLKRSQITLLTFLLILVLIWLFKIKIQYLILLSHWKIRCSLIQ